ncbi:hypothetical protein [Virgibacillus salexigens]|uniref:DUF4901 domain-containing protein n=1 Tax=Virgibacillus kapii TaxID=1638645 RepID=A0ABQ2DDC1_9BACI|nr:MULTISPECIES: hypothetical protein [Virgibacillus]MYL41033.1 hypothetical protein [Virgibacillus massiliensis]GGJ53718.1 hypothetical protein GCM10007111_14920 [Virgibacillus kapii]
MHESIQQLISHTAERLGLHTYYLKHHYFTKQKNAIGEIQYELTMEWFPNDHTDHQEDELNPPGTAVVDVDIHTGKIQTIIFVEGTSYSTSESLANIASNSEAAIEWIEEMTDLEFGRQFQLISESEREMQFRAAVDNIPVYPGGVIQVEFNQEGQLVLFSINGSFPSEHQIHWEPFALTPSIVEPIASNQCKLFEIPVESAQEWKSIYGTTTFFLTNNGKTALAYESVEASSFQYHIDQIITWEGTTNQSIPLKEIDLSTEVTEEQALTNLADTEISTLSSAKKTKAREAVQRLLQQEFSEDSGKWRLATIYREHTYLFAELRPVEPGHRIIEPKLTMILDASTLEPLNYTDNRILMEIFQDFKVADTPVITKKEAFEKLHNHLEITPVYVYQPHQKSYILCGKIECANGVDAVTGEVVNLDE